MQNNLNISNYVNLPLNFISIPANMIESNTIKYVKSLHQKKNRLAHGEFIVEGVKMVQELLQSDFHIKELFATDESVIEGATVGLTKVSEKELGRMSAMKNPNKILAVVKTPSRELVPSGLQQKLSLVLENIQDPGNMGTIIRLANWYGIEHIICSSDTVECYNPKVVQATMGALFRVNIHYTDIYKLLDTAHTWPDFGVYATHLEGENIYDVRLNTNGFILMGNESNGLSDKLDDSAIQKILIPAFPFGSQKMESLNVAVAAALTVAEFRRRQL
ncbi:MAG: RNA methyltransferase [Salinivirgaceae bacterium]